MGGSTGLSRRRKDASPANANIVTQQIAALLLAYLEATDDTEAQALAQLVEHAEPVIKVVIQYKLHISLAHPSEDRRHQDAQDLKVEVIVELLSRLREIKTNRARESINDFRSYVAVIAYRKCAEYLRRNNPLRWSLKNKLRYILTSRNGFALWKSNEEEWLCGFAGWRDREHIRGATGLRHFADNGSSIDQFAPTGAGYQQMSPAYLLAAIFNWAGSPIKFDDLVNHIADLWGVKDTAAETEGNVEETGSLELMADPSESVSTQLEQRSYLQQIWAEISKLPAPQRSALLLNLTDPNGHGVIVLLPVLGIASFREVAEALGMSAEQLADLWNDLPLDDKTVAEHLGVTRQQVINLRKSARQRLVRRTKAWRVEA